MTLWDLGTGRLRARQAFAAAPDGRGDPAIGFSPEGSLLAFSAEMAAIHLPQVEQSQNLAPLQVGRLHALRFAPRGQVLWAAVEEDQVRSWLLPEAKLRSRWENTASRFVTGLSGITDLAVGERWVVAAGGDGQTRLLRTDDGQLETTWPGSGARVGCVALTPAEDLAVTGIQNGALRLLRVPDGKVLADFAAHQDSVEAAAFSADGRLLATSSQDHTVRLCRCDGESVELLLSLRSTTGPVTALGFSGDSKTLAMLVNRESAVRL